MMLSSHTQKEKPLPAMFSCKEEEKKITRTKPHSENKESHKH